MKRSSSDSSGSEKTEGTGESSGGGSEFTKSSDAGATTNDSSSSKAVHATSDATNSNSPPTLVNLPADCASVITSFLLRRELLDGVEAGRGAAERYRPCISDILIHQGKVPADMGEARLHAELAAVLPKLPGLWCLRIHLDRRALETTQACLRAFRSAGATRRLRRLSVSLLDVPAADVCALLSTLAALVTAGELPALEGVCLGFGGHLMVEEAQPEAEQQVHRAYAAFYRSLGHANAPKGLRALHMEDADIDEEGATALAEAIEARASRGFAPFTELEAGAWLTYIGPAQRILGQCLRSLRTLDCRAYPLKGQPAVAMLTEALRFLSPLQLEDLALTAEGVGLDGAAVAAAVRYGRFPRLKALAVIGFRLRCEGLRDLIHALQHGLADLQSLELRYCRVPWHGGLERLMLAFENGVGAPLTELRVAGCGDDDTALDEAMAAVIQFGGCPMLRRVFIGDRAGLAHAALQARLAQG